jgi:ABC-type uncharacterized transport system ATPase subunit
MKKIISLMMFCAALSLSSVAYAVSQNGIHLHLVGTEGNGKQAYIGIVENPSQCAYGGVYFTVPSEVSKTLAVAMTAKTLGKTVRIDFNQPGGVGTLCFGYGIYLE